MMEARARAWRSDVTKILIAPLNNSLLLQDGSAQCASTIPEIPLSDVTNHASPWKSCGDKGTIPRQHNSVAHESPKIQSAW